MLGRSLRSTHSCQIRNFAQESAPCLYIFHCIVLHIAVFLDNRQSTGLTIDNLVRLIGCCHVNI